MKVKLNDVELSNVVALEVGIARETDEKGNVQSHLGIPEFRVVRNIMNKGTASPAALESFADVKQGATIELFFSASSSMVMEVRLSDVMVEGPELDFDAERGVTLETIHGRAGKLELVKPAGAAAYKRDVPMYPNADQ